MSRDDLVRDALQNARSSGLSDKTTARGVRRLHSLAHIRFLALAFLRELPEDMTVMEIRTALEDGP